MPSKKTVVIGILGTALDRGSGPRRWSDWRPSVSACQHEELLVNRFELIHDRKHTALANVVAADMASVSPETEVRLSLVEFDNAWDFEEVYGKLLDFARVYVMAARDLGRPPANKEELKTY